MGAVFTKYFMKMSQSTEDGAAGIISCMCLPDARSGQFWGPGAAGTSGAATPFDLESFYDNDAVRSLLWSKSEEAIGKSFEL